MRHVICDVDDTVASAFWREDLIGNGWDEYHSQLHLDKPIEPVLEMLRALERCNYVIVGCTARPEKWRKLTMEWMIKHDVPMHTLLMRPEGDFRPARELKVDLVKDYFKTNLDTVSLVLDDREDVVEAFRALGITALRVMAKEP